MAYISLWTCLEDELTAAPPFLGGRNLDHSATRHLQDRAIRIRMDVVLDVYTLTCAASLA